MRRGQPGSTIHAHYFQGQVLDEGEQLLGTYDSTATFHDVGAFDQAEE